MVLRKFTVSLFNSPGRSREAPSKLSSNVPKNAEATTTKMLNAEINPAALQLSAIKIAASIPAKVPAKLTPPSVPGGTGVQFVIKRGVAETASPYSLDTVSAAASARAAHIATSAKGWREYENDIAAMLAMPTFAITCRELLPCLASARFNARFSDSPKRVAAAAITKRQASGTKAAIPALT